ncbi:hypothetical protein BSL78_04396 [Apostichopus japonicus]|uniref:Uncharacterized protein n=1 Tax=Stichopus japonicus TaxID=307972 RepID=A0A2G8LEQ0_STIJA|nr:hypothetical protein BSL78_04396 [Apostichopus japonicus]
MWTWRCYHPAVECRNSISVELTTRSLYGDCRHSHSRRSIANRWTWMDSEVWFPGAIVWWIRTNSSPSARTVEVLTQAVNQMMKILMTKTHYLLRQKAMTVTVRVNCVQVGSYIRITVNLEKYLHHMLVLNAKQPFWNSRWLNMLPTKGPSINITEPSEILDDKNMAKFYFVLFL